MELAAAAGLATAANELGRFYLAGGGGIAADAGKARAYLDQAIAAGNSYSGIVLGQVLIRGEGLPQDVPAGIALLDAQIPGGNVAAAAGELGRLYLTGGGGIAADAAKARAYLDQAIAAGNSYSGIVLGQALLRGEGLPQDVPAAVAALAAQIPDGNVAAAASELGRFYLTGGGGIAADAGKARAYLDQAIAGGNGYSGVVLGQALIRGEGLPQDVPAGIRALKSQIPDGNVAAAAGELGRFYLAGGGRVAADAGKARAYLD
ncbi:SEL1-like repeat protein, partial [Bauldia litoralis]